MGFEIPYYKVIRHWPEGAPLLCLGGSGWASLVVTAYQEVPWSEVAASPFLLGSPQSPSYATIGLVSYDHFAGGEQNPAPSRFFRIHEKISYDPLSRRFFLSGSREREQFDFALPSAQVQALLDDLNTGVEDGSPTPAARVWSLRAVTSSAVYLRQAERVLEDIRDGRYYQLNLLRYFTCSKRPARLDLAHRLDAFGGPMSAWISVPRLDLVSYSPERFVAADWESCHQGAVRVVTSPIKGTMQRALDPVEDVQLRRTLSQSSKDRAELAMIVDLMRNDLSRIGLPRRVQVEDPGSVQSFSHVHHLVARVRAEVASELSLEHFLGALCPAGSITGAPKRAVIRAIRAYEGRERRYFMGHIFHWDGRGSMDSSILIRTAFAENDASTMEFAAGSGIVMHSSPAAELAEITAKTRVFSDHIEEGG